MNSDKPKKCTMCDQNDRNEFYSYKGAKGKIYLTSYCKKCLNDKRVKLYNDNYERKQYSVVEKTLSAKRKAELDAELRAGTLSRKKVAEKFGIPIQNIYHYYKHRIAPTLPVTDE